jgi:hypothetical protein
VAVPAAVADPEMPTPSKDASRTRYGQFDRSFVLRVIRSYLISALLLLLLLLAFTYALFRYQFETEVPEQTRQTAESLASDVTSIMINEGGPVASRTVYPILERNYNRLGFDIAIEPSQATIESIEKRFGFEPKGIPSRWPEGGSYKESSVTLNAQRFCIQCHVDTDVGDPLGTVVVRNYFASYLKQWQEDATLSGIAGMLNVIISTIIIFCVMRSRMEPVLRLRAMVSRWAKGTMPLDERIEVKSEDEFGELSHDLNLTLDRIFAILQDLRDNVGRQREIDADVGQEIDRLGKLAERLQSELQDSGRSDQKREAHTLEELRHSITRLHDLCRNLKDVLQGHERLMKRLE